MSGVVQFVCSIEDESTYHNVYIGYVICYGACRRTRYPSLLQWLAVRLRGGAAVIATLRTHCGSGCLERRYVSTYYKEAQGY